MSSSVPESAAPLAIEARGLVKQFGGRRALDGLDLELPQGAFLSIFGPNGAGKTTLLRELALLARPTGGELRILGVDALEEPDVLRSRIGLISHKSMLYGDLTARENLAFFASLYGLEGPEASARIDELLRLVELDHRANDVPVPSRAVCSSASPLPVPSSTTPSSCCSTSRIRASIRMPRSSSIV